MPTLTEGGYANGFVISEAPGTFSRENATLISGQNLLAGRVLGKITASGKYTALAPAAGDGSQTAAAILVADTDASAADKTCAVIARNAEVNNLELGWGALSGGQITTATAQLAAATVNIIVRTGI